jgi:HD-GYP domain-containing protein (c-di-GMP phosphodiesterase class II)
VPLQATLAELRRCVGSQFDPAVVSAFLAAVESGAIDSMLGVASDSGRDATHA